ncbi:MAG TPA: fasciclin domain-containing protein [Candidatus Obscuribacterales bacterium]
MKTRIFSTRLLAIAGAMTLGVATSAVAQTEANLSELAAPTPTAAEVAQAPGTIVDVASSVEDFSTLVAALEAADLVAPLQGEGPFTVFAPTNDAFDALPEGVVDALLLPENQDLLTQVLTYHVVPGEALSTDLSTGPVTTLNGDDVAVTVADDGVMVNNADVIAADVPASNGVIHVIDEVLVPAEVVAELESRLAAEPEPAPVAQPAPATAQPAPAAAQPAPAAAPVRGLW